MKKYDFKKLALLGATSGTLLASQASAMAIDANSHSQTLAYGGCGGGSTARQGCGSMYYQAYRNTPSSSSSQQYYYSGEEQTQTDQNLRNSNQSGYLQGDTSNSTFYRNDPSSTYGSSRSSTSQERRYGQTESYSGNQGQVYIPENQR